MHLCDWVFDGLQYLGLRNKKAKLLIVGLKNSGKTTLLWNLAGCPSMSGALMATSRCGSETLTKGNVVFTTLDVGAHGPSDELRANIMRGGLAIIFMVDVTDAKGFDLAAAELHALAAAKELKEVPILVLGNKANEGFEGMQ